MLNPVSLPSWLSETDVDFYATEFVRTGFRGGLNWYRNIDRNWELLAPFAGAKVSVPALYIAGERDVVLDFPGIRQRIPNMVKFVPQLRRTIILPGCGHWTQQERPPEVNTANDRLSQTAVEFPADGRRHARLTAERPAHRWRERDSAAS
jgi:pimeloyl-ACP methyl ester carboxylesterase